MAIVERAAPLPGRMFMVFCEGDAWGHERVLIWPLSASRWLARAPRGDFHGEDATLCEEVVFVKSPGERPPGLEASGVV
eukprot:3577128-Pyramimonas_sp.AAC.1